MIVNSSWGGSKYGAIYVLKATSSSSIIVGAIKTLLSYDYGTASAYYVDNGTGFDVYIGSFASKVSIINIGGSAIKKEIVKSLPDNAIQFSKS